MMTRQYPERPIFGVGAIILKDEKVLLIKRGQEPLKDFWSLPGGAQETGETTHEALRRGWSHGKCRKAVWGQLSFAIHKTRTRGSNSAAAGKRSGTTVFRQPFPFGH